MNFDIFQSLSKFAACRLFFNQTIPPDVFRVNPDADRTARSRHSNHRDSSSRNGLDDIECFTSIADESHSKTITGVC